MENIQKITDQKTSAKFSAVQKQELIGQWQSSGKSQKQFCAERDLKYLTFVSWVCKHRKAEQEHKTNSKRRKNFTRLHIVNPAVPFAEIKLSPQISISIFHSVDADYLRALLG